MKRTLILFIALCTYVSVFAQNVQQCGFVPSSTSQTNYEEFQDFKTKYRQKKLVGTESTSGLDTIELQIYVCRNNNGETDITLDNFYNSLDSLNTVFADIQLCMVPLPNVVFVDNSNLENLVIPGDYNELYENRNNRAINVYYHQSIMTPNCSLNGLGNRLFYKDGGSINLVKDATIETFIHEFGHVFGLFHPHGKYNIFTEDCQLYSNNNLLGFDLELYCQGAVELDNNESIDNNNDSVPDCAQTGDEICDTPASPLLFGAIDNCNYTGTQTDIFGDTYNPIVSNIMSYGKITDCGPLFTQGQLDKMRYTFEKYGGYLRCSCDSDQYLVTSLDNFGSGSFFDGISCGYVCNNITNISFDNSITFEELELNDIIYIKSNLEIDGSLGSDKVLTIDFGNSLFLPFALFIEDLSQNVKLSNFELKGLFTSGIQLGDNTTEISLENISLQDFEVLGIRGDSTHNLEIKDCNFEGMGNGTGIRILDSDSILIESCIAHNLNRGFSLERTNNVTIIKNKIGEDKMGNPSLIELSCLSIYESSNVSIGDEDLANSNTFANSNYNGVDIAQNSTNCLYGINSNYCNANSALNISADSNMGLNRPFITLITSDKLVKGTGEPNANIDIYRSNDTCQRCSGYEWLGNVEIATTGMFEIILEDFLDNGDMLIGIQSKSNISSSFSWCKEYVCSPTSNDEIIYNGIDDDCSTTTLDDDLDQDGFVLANDCDDTNPDINPDQNEIPYNGIDDDCNSITLDDDIDQDGFVLANDCDDTNPNINPDQSEMPYNGFDDDCNATTLDDDLDQDGFLLAEDCDDTNSLINPNAIEIPNNGIDEDCDGEDLMTATHEIGLSTINIFPNPVRENVYIRIDNLFDYNVRVLTIDGKLIYQGSNSSSFNVSQISNGLYILQVVKSDIGESISELILVAK